MPSTQSKNIAITRNNPLAELYISSLSLFCMVDTLTPDVHVSSLLHPAILSHYCPVVTAPDGDCLWHSLFICLLGTQELSNTLRMQTVNVMKQNKTFFLRLIQTDQINEPGTPDEIFDRHLQIAATNGRYVHEYHILALAIIVQRVIYAYSRFV